MSLDLKILTVKLLATIFSYFRKINETDFKRGRWFDGLKFNQSMLVHHMAYGMRSRTS